MPSGRPCTGSPVDTPLLRMFVDDVFEPLQRVEQRRWAQAYLAALLTVRGKKTLRKLAAAVSPAGFAAHGLQRFVNVSPWDWAPVRRRLAHAITAQANPQAWTLADLTIPKRGEHSVGVHRA
jgi:SRSO17 transposase